jgi:transcriptional regulator with XRE-family HTH domain
MTAVELRNLLARLDLTQAGAARLLGINDRTMRRYVLGERSIPEPIRRLLEVAENGHLNLAEGRDRRRKPGAQ